MTQCLVTTEATEARCPKLETKDLGIFKKKNQGESPGSIFPTTQRQTPHLRMCRGISFTLNSGQSTTWNLHHCEAGPMDSPVPRARTSTICSFSNPKLPSFAKLLFILSRL